jgi:hypothetical protein
LEEGVMMDISTSKIIALIKAIGGGGGGGSGGGSLIVNDVEGTLDKTFKEIKDAVDAGYYVQIKKAESDPAMQFETASYYSVGTVTSQSSEYDILVYGLIDGEVAMIVYVTDSENGYPTAYYGGDGDGGAA